MPIDFKNQGIMLGLTLLVATAAITTIGVPLAQGQGIKPCPGGLPGQLAAPNPGQPGKTRQVDSCPLQGKGGANSQAQNQAKNNFCAKAVPIPITLDTLIKLQQVVDTIPQNKLPRGTPQTIPTAQQRKQLQHLKITGADGKQLTLGEGDAVVLAAFVNGARHSNVCSGEDVNCKDLGCENNDIHIELSDSALSSDEASNQNLKDQKLCRRGVVAEISPHFRPAEWENFDSADFQSDFAAHPIRFKGQLFYDASHPPCNPQKPEAPIRVAVWEPFAQRLGKKAVQPGVSCQPCQHGGNPPPGGQ